MTFPALAASDFIYDLWCDGSRVDEFPIELRPQSRAQGYAVQELLERRSAAPLFGWKLAATSKAGQEHINVDGPLIGRILRERVIADGATYVGLNRNMMRVAELEYAFRFSRDIAPRAETWALRDALELVESLHPAIEIPDSRFNRYDLVGAPQLIADNACAHSFVLGPAAPNTWRDVDLANHQPWGLINRSPYRQGSGRNVLEDPRLALVWFLNEASGHGMTIRAGEIVTTGTCLTPISLTQGMSIAGDFGALGFVSVDIA